MTSKDNEIKKEIKNLNAIFKDIPDDKKKLVDGLIQNAAFMKVTLLELQRDVLENGAMIAVQSGNGFDTIKDNPAQKAYTTMISRYIAITAQLQTLLPSKDQTNSSNLLDWVENN